MTVDIAKTALLDELRWARRSVLQTLDGLSEYEIRRPMTASGTNLLGVIGHLAVSERVYLGDVLGRPFPRAHPRFDDPGFRNRNTLWVDARTTRAEVLLDYEQACQHADSSVDQLPLSASGHVPWWPQPDVRLVNVLVHVLTETTRHAGHADIVRESLRGAVGDLDDWADHVARIESAAQHHRT